MEPMCAEPMELDSSYLRKPTVNILQWQLRHFLLLFPISRGSRGVSRSTLAYLHSAGFEELRDTRGNPLPSVEGAGPKPSAVLEQDPLKTGPFQVSVQLMAFSFSV